MRGIKLNAKCELLSAYQSKLHLLHPKLALERKPQAGALLRAFPFQAREAQVFPPAPSGVCGAQNSCPRPFSLAAAATGMPTGQGGRKLMPIIDAVWRPCDTFEVKILANDQRPRLGVELSDALDHPSLFVFGQLREHRQGEHFLRRPFGLGQVTLAAAQVGKAGLQV